MTQTTLRPSGVCILLCCLGMGSAQAVSLDSLLSPGAILSLGGLTFANWSADFLASAASFDPDLDNIEVTATEIDDVTIALRLDAGTELTVTGTDPRGDFVDLALSFTVSFAGRQQLDLVALGLEGSVTPADSQGSLAYVSERLYASPADHDPDFPDDKALDLGGSKTQLIVQIDPASGTPVTADQGDLDPTRRTAFVYTNIAVNAAPGETAGITRIIQYYTGVPAPETWMLFLGGLGLLIATARRHPRAEPPAP